MSVIAEPPHRAEVRERRWIVASVGLVTVAAWLTLWLADGSSYGFLHDHDAIRGASHGGLGGSLAMPLFVAGWTVMTLAMMLPTSLPILHMFHAIVRPRPDRWLLVGLVVAGYVATWVLLGVAVYFARVVLGLGLGALPERAEQARLGGPLLLLLAGAFQFTSLKDRCLDRCRSPLGFVLRHWRERRPRRQAFRLGVDNGLFCVGCCWALMLLMFAVGSGSLGWMLVLAAVMAVEKNLSWGRRISVPVGLTLILWGAVLLVLRA
jgi:predicted metal-binding membrane protein